MFVLDASVIVASMFRDEVDHATARELWAKIYCRAHQGLAGRIVFSDLLLLEVETVLLRSAKPAQGGGLPRMGSDAYRHFIQTLQQQLTLEFIVYHSLGFNGQPRLLASAREIGLAHNLKLPDAIYVAQCRLYGAQLISFDNQQCRVAQTMGLFANLEKGRI